MLSKFNISPSTIKGYNDVDMGEMCGLFFKASYIDKTVDFKSKPEFTAGQWTEWRMTGALPRDGKKPVPEMTAKKELTAMYKKLDSQVHIWHDYVKHNKIENITTGRVLEYEFEGYNIKGILDVDYMDDDIFTIIDIKTTAFIDNKWEKYGWKEIDNKKLLTIQAPAYVWLVNKVLGIPIEKIAFKFYVVSSQSEFERKIFNMKVYESSLQWFESEIRYTTKAIEHNDMLGWASTMNYKHCIDCDLRASCDRRIFHPVEETIHML